MDKNQTLQISSEIRAFLEGLLTDAGMTTLDSQMREEMVKELYARLDNFMTTAVVDNLPPEHLDAFIKLNEEKKPKEEIEAFLKANMPNSTEVFAKALIEFRDLYLGNVTVARNAPQQSGTGMAEPPVPTPPQPAPLSNVAAASDAAQKLN